MASGACGTSNPGTQTAIQMLNTIGFPIGLFMMVYMGIKWMVAEGPEERENARRGIIYIVIGLILLQTARGLVEGLLC